MSLFEMEAYLLSVFRVLFSMRTGADHGEATPELIAQPTTQSVFEVAGVSLDGYLTFEQFQAWYSDPEDGQEEDGTWLNMGNVKFITGLQNVECPVLLELFATKTDHRGRIPISFFIKCMEIIQQHYCEAELDERIRLATPWF